MWAIIVAAGAGSRMKDANLSYAKQFLEINDTPLFWHCAKKFAQLPFLQGVVLVLPTVEDNNFIEYYTKIIAHLEQKQPLSLQYLLAEGGETRQESVRAGIALIPKKCKHVFVHDAARPFFTASLVTKVQQALLQGHDAVIPGVQLSDTIKEIKDGKVLQTYNRETLHAIQTPQGFFLEKLEIAHHDAQKNNFTGTDDASLMERMNFDVTAIEGEINNRKITHPDDLILLQLEDKYHEQIPVSGIGYDVHRYGGTRPFILGGVPIPTNLTIEAHSDGDVLLHALADAILGCLGSDAGDIGQIFPDYDPTYANYPSGIFVSHALDKARQKGVTITHIDATIIAEAPTIAPHRDSIAKNIASLAQISKEQVNIKATTEEGLGFIGEKKGLKTIVIVNGLQEKSYSKRPAKKEFFPASLVHTEYTDYQK